MMKLSRKEREQAQKLDAIIDAAIKVFYSKGFDNAKMEDVASQAEYSKGSLYFYFKSKNELCLAIVNRSLNHLTQSFDNILQTEATGIDKIAQIVEAFINFRTKKPDYYQSIISFRNHHQNCDNESDYMKANILLNQEINTIFISMLEAGKKDGTIKTTIDSQMTANCLWGNLSGLLPGFLLNDETNTNYSSFDLLRYWYNLILQGLAISDLTNLKK